MSEENFPQFDVVTDVSDHHFAKKNSKISSTTPNSAVHKKITQEWKLLSKDLPESIFVRVYETRIDLIRAAIVGARGTPYHDGLFFFDIAFPSDYPAKPPLVYYHSFGYRINPNLYNNGRVCLSLLNTWTGNKSEKWDPKNSTLLQVLLSIQALVLNERPYFNEPGFSSWSGKAYMEKKSSAYSEGVFLLNCKTMLLVLRKPPKNFEALANQHFKDRAGFILNACDSYRKGLARVGFFSGVLEGRGEVSVKFKGPMDQLYGNLVMALSKTGASVGNLIKLVEEEREKKAKEREAAIAAAKNKPGIDVGKVAKSVVKKLKKIMFLG